MWNMTNKIVEKVEDLIKNEHTFGKKSKAVIFSKKGTDLWIERDFDKFDLCVQNNYHRFARKETFLIQDVDKNKLGLKVMMKKFLCEVNDFKPFNIFEKESR